jgi:hypothetical protein
MAQEKTTFQRRIAAELAKRSPRSPSIPHSPLYGISPLHPGKLVQRLADGTERIGTFRDGVFVPE